MTTLPLDRIIRVTSTITATQPLRADFGRTLLVTSDDTLRPPHRTRVYADIAAVGRDFETTSQPYIAAQKYFGVTPYPKNLVIGSWFSAAGNSRIRGGGSPSALAGLQAVTAGTLVVGGVTTAAMDFSGGGSQSAIATIVESAVVAASGNIVVWAQAATYTHPVTVEGSDGNFYTSVQDSMGDNPITDSGANWLVAGPQLDAATVVFSEGRFILEVPGATQAIVNFPSSTAQNVAGVLGFTEAEGAMLQAGYNADASLAAGINAIRASNSSAFWAVVDEGITAETDLLAFAAAIQSQTRMAATVDVVGDPALVPNETTSIAAQLFALGYSRVFWNWSATRQNQGIAMCARMSSVNFNGNRTLVNPVGRPLSGVASSPLGDNIAGADEIERKRGNYYTDLGARARWLGGTMIATGVWIDSAYFVDWLEERIQLDADNYITSNPTRTPQTDLGLAGLLATVEGSCRAGRRVGGIAPGQIEESLANDVRVLTGNGDFDGFLTQGYLVYAPPFSTLSAGQVRARQSPGITVWLKGSGAINEADIGMIFEG